MTIAPDMALVGAALVLPDRVVRDGALLLAQGRIAAVVDAADIPADCPRRDLGGGWLLPGFIDTQVNGGGDVLFNDCPTVDGIRTIAMAHRRFGTTGLLPTLISDHGTVVDLAIDAGEAALAQQVPGVLGVHIEGPYLNPAKKGIHDASRITPIDAALAARLAVPTAGRRIVTLAPECAAPGIVKALTQAGVLVCGGHSMATYENARAALDEGLAGFTHLFNAMTQFQSRAPGMVGAALEDRASHFGIILDGEHVHPAALRVAIAARGRDGVMLVTDAMPPVGGQGGGFMLMGCHIVVVDGTCRGDDGTLAGSALTMAQAFRNAMTMLGCDIVDASAMASGNPARFLRLADQTGSILPGLRADLVHMDDNFAVRSTWIGGQHDDLGE